MGSSLRELTLLAGKERNSNLKNSLHLLSTYYVPASMLSILHVFSFDSFIDHRYHYCAILYMKKMED